jgi:hypothetical protein
MREIGFLGRSEVADAVPFNDTNKPFLSIELVPGAHKTGASSYVININLFASDTFKTRQINGSAPFPAAKP